MATPTRFRFTLRDLGLGLLFLCALFALIKLYGDMLLKSRRAALASAAQGPLNQMLVALHNYHDVYGQFPPAYIADANGKPLHSWRVLILPFLEQQALYNLYNFNEPWNGPNNSKLATTIPINFQSPSEPRLSPHTSLVVIVGPGTAFPGAASTSLSDFQDGTANTILLTEISNSDILWLEPRDLHVDQMSFKTQDRSKPSISSVRWRDPYVVFADTIRAYALSPNLPPDSLQALTTIAGGEPIDRETLVQEGKLR